MNFKSKFRYLFLLKLRFTARWLVYLKMRLKTSENGNAYFYFPWCVHVSVAEVKRKISTEVLKKKMVETWISNPIPIEKIFY